MIFVAIHMAACFLAILVTFGQEIKRFETGDPEPMIQRVAEVIGLILLSPIDTWLDTLPVQAYFPGLLGYIPMMMNSLLWGIVVWLIAAAITRISFRRARGRPRSSSAPKR